MNELSAELAKERKVWIVSILALSNDGFVISDFDESLMSPQFNCGSWRIGAEHTRKFRSVVLRWLGEPGSVPAPPRGAKNCPPSDIKKDWQFRKKIRPDELEDFLTRLNSPSML